MHPILFEFGKLRIYSYGVMVALGFLIALYFAAREAKRAGIAPEKMFDIGLQAILFGIISARALHVFVNLSYYAASPLDIIMINKGGLAFHGGLFGGILAVWYYIKRNKMNLWKTADVIIPYVALGQSIGRIGCLLNGCCYGTPTQLPIGISFPGRLLPLHPTQVYSSVFLFLMFIVLKRLYPVRDIRDTARKSKISNGVYRRKLFDGAVFFLYLVFYSFGRFFIDFFRGDLHAVCFGLKLSQIISIGIFFPSLFMLILKSIVKWKSIRLR